MTAHAHAREPSHSGASTVKVETPWHLVKEGKLFKAIQRARTKYDAEVRGLPTTARPMKEQIELTVRDEFPDEPQAGADAILTPEQLDWRSGEVDYGKRADGGDRAAPVCIHFVWRAPCTQTRW
jgi:hypothetical protein